MYSVILFACLSGVVFASLNFRRRDWLARFAHAAFGALIGVFVGLFVALLASPLATVHREELGRWELVAMRTADSTAGVFVWGSGSLEHSTIYRVMISNQDGSMSPFQAVASSTNTRIIEEDDLQDSGYLVIRVSVPDKTWINYWVIGKSAGCSYEYHVPKGTVRNTFNAN